MSSISTVPLSIRIGKNIKQELDEVAKQDNRSTSALATELIEKYLETRRNKRLAIDQALKEADNGEFVSHGEMRTWFASLGSDNELPFPKPDVTVKAK